AAWAVRAARPGPAEAHSTCRHPLDPAGERTARSRRRAATRRYSAVQATGGRADAVARRLGPPLRRGRGTVIARRSRRLDPAGAGRPGTRGQDDLAARGAACPQAGQARASAAGPGDAQRRWHADVPRGDSDEHHEYADGWTRREFRPR